MVYLHRYLRITPMYMIIVAFATFVFPLLSDGPYWFISKLWAGNYERNWWKNLLFINNLPIYDTVKDRYEIMGIIHMDLYNKEPFNKESLLKIGT